MINEHVGSSRKKIVVAAVFGFIAGAVVGVVVGVQLSLNEPVLARAVDHKAHNPQEDVARQAIAIDLALNDELENAEIKANHQIAGERQKLAALTSPHQSPLITHTKTGITLPAGATLPVIMLTRPSANPANSKGSPVMLETIGKALPGCYVLGEARWVDKRLFLSVNRMSCGNRKMVQSVHGVVVYGSGMVGFAPRMEKLKMVFTRTTHILQSDTEGKS